MANVAISSAVLLGIISCTQGHLNPAGLPPAPAHGATAAAEVESWIPRISPGLRQYLLQDSSIVSINNDTINKPLPIKTTVNYSISIQSLADSFLISGKIDSLAINSRIHTNSVLKDSAAASEFHGVVTTQGKIESTSQQQLLSCSATNSVMISRIYELFVPYPRSALKVGDRWSDTVSTTTCHGRTPVTQHSVREFTVTQFETTGQRNVVSMTRTTTISFMGASKETNTHLSASGSGSGDATLLVDRTTGNLLESTSHTKSSLVISTSRGEFPFTQLTSTHILVR